MRNILVYEHEGVSYASKEDMAEDILQNLKNVNLQEVFLFSYGIQKSTFYFREGKRTCECILDFIKPKNKISKKKEFKVCSFVLDGQVYYRCCGRNFKTFEEASKFSSKKQCTVKFGKNIIQTFNKSASPNEVRKSTLITTENILPVAPKKSCVKTMYSTKCLAKNALSYKIWSLVWSDIGPTYYNDALLSMFKTRFLKEINVYRQFHGSPSLLDNHKYLSAAAQEHANLLAKHKTLLHFGSRIFYTLMGSIKLRYMSFLMKIWYDQIKYFDFKKNCFNILAEEFSAMVWKNSRYLGIGVAVNDDKAYVVLKFFPKGNSRNQFKTNVRNVIMSKAEK